MACGVQTASILLLFFCLEGLQEFPKHSFLHASPPSSTTVTTSSMCDFFLICWCGHAFAQILSHREVCASRSLYTDTFTHRSFYTRCCTQRCFRTAQHLRTEAFTHRPFHTETLLRAEVFTGSSLYAQKTAVHTAFHFEGLGQIFLNSLRRVSMHLDPGQNKTATALLLCLTHKYSDKNH